MCEPFIRNHQYNFIKKQADSVLSAFRTVSDPKVLESVRYGAQSKVEELFPDIHDSRKSMLLTISDLQKEADHQRYLQAIEPYLMAFPSITEKQILKLFPNNKKMKLPVLADLDLRHVSYLSWIDISTNKMFLVYPDDERFVGVEGRYTATNKKNYCFVCNRYEELVLFSANTKKRPAHAAPDYYKSVGNYLCMDSHACNKNITDVSSLEKFIASVLE